MPLQPGLTRDVVTPGYFTAYENFSLERSPGGILTVRMHTGGKAAVYTGVLHRDLTYLLGDIDRDRDNKVMVLVGTGESFLHWVDVETATLGRLSEPRVWDQIYWEGRRTLRLLLELEMPIIAAVNGPARIHSEYALLADIVVASDRAVFSDPSHLDLGLVPGDGIHVVYEELLGVNRARYFALTQQEIDAPGALALGLVAEVLPPEQVLPRAMALADRLAARRRLLLRYTVTALRQRLLRRICEGTQLGMALEGLTAADARFADG